ncbi:MAG: hypothetical protein ACE5E7_00590 [Anaerolineae bacterium]
MRNVNTLERGGTPLTTGLALAGLSLPRKAVIGGIMMLALLAFEIFNFDTTRYALRSLLGDVSFLGIYWASILAIAFCSIDFAGLVRIFTPQKGRDEPKEVWYLMGAWLLGATMNALMTWWAVALTLLNHEFGNEVLSREQLLHIVPVFVAVLVWLTRILFIGAFTVAGEHIFDISALRGQRTGARPSTAARQPRQGRPQPPVRQQPVTSAQASVQEPSLNDELPGFLDGPQTIVARRRSEANGYTRNVSSSNGHRPQNGSRIRRRPAMKNGVRRTPLNGVQARPRR